MKASILVVDDQVGIARTTQIRLASQGFDVDTAGDGEEALVRIEQKKYDIILLDVNMPRMNGIQVLEFITSKHPYSDVIMMTAFDDYSLASECLEKGAKEFLLKPIDFTEVLSRINALLRVREADQRFENLRNYWQSTVLFDVYSSLQSIQFILNHTIKANGSVLSEKDASLLKQARDMNDQISRTLKESTKVNNYATCNRSNKCTDCALKDNVKEYDLEQGFFLLGQTNTDINALVKKIVDKYEPCLQGGKIKFQLANDSQLPMIKCDPERVEQVLTSIFESAIEASNQGDPFSVTMSKSQTGIGGQPFACVMFSFDYSNNPGNPDERLTNVANKETEWRNIYHDLNVNTVKLSISRRIIEAQGGEFFVEAGKDNRVQIRLTLPLA